MAESYFDLDRTFSACSLLVTQIQDSGHKPDIVVGLATGGNFCAQRVAELLGISTVIVLPVQKRDGVRSLDPTARLVGKYIADNLVLGIDDVIITGKLLKDLQHQVYRRDGRFMPAALVGVGNFPSMNGLVVAHELTEVPTFFWEDGLPH